ncbi:MAG: prefoldin subunit alpha [archaeon]
MKKKIVVPKEKEELYYELKQADKNIKKIQKHIETLDEQFSELETVKEALNEFENTKEGTEIKVPLSSGIYATASITNSSKLLVNVGANVVVEKKPDEILKMLEIQQEEVKSHRAAMMVKFHELVHVIEELQEKITE